MREKRKVSPRNSSAAEILDKQYLESENREAIDYWDPLAQIIMEMIEARHAQGLSQAGLATLMKTKQSVISRFENMGRKPNYDFFARLSIALKHAPGATLYGEYMAVLPIEEQGVVNNWESQAG